MKHYKTILLFIYFFINISPAYSVIKVGTALFNPPFILSGGIGFDTQFIQLVCQQLKETCEYKSMPINKLFKAIDSGKIDLAIGGITIHSGGSPKYIYSLPYLLSKGDFLVLQNAPSKTVNDLIGKKIGILIGNQDGDVFNLYLLVNYTDEFEIVQFKSMSQLLYALNRNDISAAFIHESVALYWVVNGSGQFRLLGQPEIVGDGIGIMASEKNTALIHRINIAILKLVQGQAYMNLYNMYFGAER